MVVTVTATQYVCHVFKPECLHAEMSIKNYEHGLGPLDEEQLLLMYNLEK